MTFLGGSHPLDLDKADEVAQMLAKLIIASLIIAFDGCIFDRSVHSLELIVGPGVSGLGRPVFNTVFCAGIFEGVSAEYLVIRNLSQS
nr:hypothetical protein [Neorhizobium tomejilense]